MFSCSKKCRLQHCFWRCSSARFSSRMNLYCRPSYLGFYRCWNVYTDQKTLHSCVDSVECGLNGRSLRSIQPEREIVLTRAVITYHLKKTIGQGYIQSKSQGKRHETSSPPPPQWPYQIRFPEGFMRPDTARYGCLHFRFEVIRRITPYPTDYSTGSRSFKLLWFFLFVQIPSEQ